jgi:disulfide oxidoreductase YuzD
MATELILKTKDGAIIPKADLPDFPQGLVKLEDLETKLIALKAEAKTIKVVDEESFIRAGVIIAEKKSVDKLADAAMTPFDTVLKKVSDFIKVRKLRVKNSGEELAGILEPKMSAYKRDKAAKDAADAKRIQEELEAKQRQEADEQKRKDVAASKEVKKQRVAQARIDRAAGKITQREFAKILREADEELEAAKEEAEATAEERKNAPIVVEVKTKHTTVAGMVQRTNYYAESKQKVEFLAEAIKRAAAGDNSMIEFLEVSDKKLAAKAREVKDSKKMEALYPFVHAWDEDTF